MKQHALLGTLFSFMLMGCAPETQAERVLQQEGADAAPAQDGQVGLSDEGPDEHLMYRPDGIEWQDAPASLESGGDIAVLEGDPSKNEVFTMRIRMPDGYYISPHWHPNVERVTVVSGVFLLGSGDTLNREETESLEPGSYTSLPPETTHYAIADGETVIQLTSVGPWVINYVNPEDDPRTRE